MTESELRVGLLGCGAIGDQHAQAVHCVPGATLTAVYDPDATRMTYLARAHNALPAESAQELCARRDVDAVVIATPTDTHRDLTLVAAEAGNHVLLEKPAGLAVAELDEVQQACDQAGVVLLIGQSLRFDHIARALRETVDADDLGQLALFQWVSNTARPWPGGWQGWQLDAARSGGMAVHLGIHSIDLAIWLIDSPPARVYARGMNLAAPAVEINDYLHINLRYENGANALLEVHSSLKGAGNRYQEAFLLGSEGQAQWKLSDDSLYIGDGGTRFLGVDASESLRLQMSHFIDCCRGSAAPLVTPAEVRSSLAVALAVNQSLRTNQAVEMGMD